MRIYILLITLICSIPSFAQQSSGARLVGTYILTKMEKEGFIVDFEDMEGTIRRAIGHYKSENKLQQLKQEDSLGLVEKFRNNFDRVASFSRFIITFNQDGSFNWKSVSGDNSSIMFSGTYLFNSTAKEIVLTKRDEAKKAIDKMYLKLLFTSADSLEFKVSTDASRKNYEPERYTLRKKYL